MCNRFSWLNKSKSMHLRLEKKRDILSPIMFCGVQSTFIPFKSTESPYVSFQLFAFKGPVMCF